MSSPSDARRRLTAATVGATLATLAGYVASLLQWAIYARVLGVSTSTDALAAALAWIIGSTGLVGATFASVTVPSYLRAMATSPVAARDIFRTANTSAIVFGLAIALLTFGAAAPLSVALLPGSEEPSRRELFEILRVSAPLGVLWVVVYTLSSLANARERYVLAAGATAIPSIPVIAVLLLLPHPSVVQVASAFVVGITLEILALGAAVRPWWGHLVPALSRGSLAQLGRIAAPVVAAFLLLSVSTVVLRAIASFGGSGDVSIVDYATRIVTAVETVLLSGALAVVLTVWSADEGNPTAERLPLLATVRATLGFVVPAAFAVLVFAPAMVDGLFGGGRFTAEDVDQVSRFLAWISLGLAAHALYMVIVRAMLARGSTMSFLASAGAELLVFAVSGWALRAGFGLAGLGAAFSLSWLVAVLVGAASLRPLRDGALALAVEAGRSIVAGLVPSAVALLGLLVLPRQPLVQLALGGVVFAVSWLLVGQIAGLVATRAAVAALRSYGGALRGTEVSGA